jgi:hypothetical protein
MSLERLDVRFKLNPDDHAALRILCDARGCEIQEFIEELVTAEVNRRINEASLIMRELQRRGLSGTGGQIAAVPQGKPGNGKTGSAG